MKFILPCSSLSRSPPRNSFIISGFFLLHASPENNKNIKILSPELLNKFGNGTNYWMVVQWTLGKTEIRWTNLSDQTKQLENILRYNHAIKKKKNKTWWLQQLTTSHLTLQSCQQVKFIHFDINILLPCILRIVALAMSCIFYIVFYILLTCFSNI